MLDIMMTRPIHTLSLPHRFRFRTLSSLSTLVFARINFSVNSAIVWYYHRWNLPETPWNHWNEVDRALPMILQICLTLDEVDEYFQRTPQAATDAGPGRGSWKRSAFREFDSSRIPQLGSRLIRTRWYARPYGYLTGRPRRCTVLIACLTTLSMIV